MVVNVVFGETSIQGCPLMETSQGEALCNQWAQLITIVDQTQAPWQPLPHFPKQRKGRHSACVAAVTWCYAWLTQGQLAAAQCLFPGMGAQWLHTIFFTYLVYHR